MNDNFNTPMMGNNNKQVLIIVGIIAVFLIFCCCCAMSIVWLWFNGDNLLSEFSGLPVWLSMLT